MSSATASQHYWRQRSGRITTTIGKWIAGDDVSIRGHSLLKDILGKMSYTQLHVLNITGRVVSRPLATWIENNYMGSSYPDARLWCNQIGAIAGTQDTSSVAAIAAGCLAADSRAYGGSMATFITMNYLQRARERLTAGLTIDALIDEAPIKHGRPAIVGFVRPIDKSDERIEPYKKMTRKLGFRPGPYMRLAENLSAIMEQRFATGMNFGGFSSAFLLDQDFSPQEGYLIRSLCVSSGVAACYVDNLQHPEKSFLPLKCADISYDGPQPRPLPK